MDEMGKREKTVLTRKTLYNTTKGKGAKGKDSKHKEKERKGETVKKRRGRDWLRSKWVSKISKHYSHIHRQYTVYHIENEKRGKILVNICGNITIIVIIITAYSTIFTV